MINKINIQKAKFNVLPAIGMVMMSLASIAGFFEFTDHKAITFGRAVTLPSVSVLATENALNEETTTMNKEKEGVAPEYVSYSEIQRTAPRASRY